MVLFIAKRISYISEFPFDHKLSWVSKLAPQCQLGALKVLPTVDRCREDRQDLASLRGAYCLWDPLRHDYKHFSSAEVMTTFKLMIKHVTEFARSKHT